MNFKLAYRNIYRNFRRSLSTGLAVCVGFVGLNLLGAYLYRTKKAIDMVSIYTAQRGHFLVFKKEGYKQFEVNPKKFIFSSSEFEALKSNVATLNSQIEFTGQQIHSTGLITLNEKSHPVIIYGVDPEAFHKSFSHPEMYNWASDWVLDIQKKSPDLFIKNPEGISLTPVIVDILNGSNQNVDQQLLQIASRNIDGDLNAIDSYLVGRHTTGLQLMEDTVAIMPVKKVQELLSTDGILSLSIFLNQDVSWGEFEKNLSESLKKLPFETEIHRFDSPVVNPFHQGTMGFLYVMGFFFVFLVGTAVSLTLINSLTMGIIERTREIGTLRAIGFRKTQIQELFILETAILCTVSMFVGALISYIISILVNSADIMFYPPAASQPIQFMLRWNIWIAISVFGFLFIVGYISSYFVTQKKTNSSLIALLQDLEG